MGDRGGTATSGLDMCQMRALYPMGDRGGTATESLVRAIALIIPDGRSGGNRNPGKPLYQPP